MKITHYKIIAPIGLKAAVLADYHSSASRENRRTDDTENLLAAVEREHPDVIFAPGDILNSTNEKSVSDISNISGLKLLSGAAEIAPVYYSVGNHEQGMNPSNRAELEKVGVTLLDNESVRVGDIVIGGFTSGYKHHKSYYKQKKPEPDCSFIEKFSSVVGYKILLCHHPEYWEKYIAGRGVNVTVSGHAHGGQWALPGGHGFYAPGQGLFPKYVRGIIGDSDDKENGILTVSRGMTNTVPVPRFFNPCEIVILHFGQDKKGGI